MKRILLVLTGLTVAARAAGAAGSPLSGDSRFQKHLTLSIKGTAVTQILDDLRTTQGLPVRADAATGDDRINLFCRDRPGSEVLRAVADALDFTWQHDTRGTGYVLTQTPRQQQEEREARDRILAVDLASL